MSIIDNNPYRIAGILANATAREIEKQKSKIARFASVGKEVTSELDFPFLPKIERTEDSAKTAFAKIEQNHDKVNYSLFWYINNGPLDTTAFNYLSENNIAEAKELWGKAVEGKDVSSNNFSYFNNLGTLLLSDKSLETQKKGIALKFQLINSSQLSDFTSAVADANYKVDSQEQTNQTVADLLAYYKADPEFASHNVMELFQACSPDVQEKIAKKFTEDPLHNIESRIETCKGQRKKNAKEAYTYGLTLYKETEQDLLSLRSILSSDALQFKMIADKLAKEILQCGIDYFQALNEYDNPTIEAIELCEYAKAIAIGEQVMDRIKDNMSAIKEWGVGQPSKEHKEKVKEDHEAVTKALDEFKTKPATLKNANDLMVVTRPHLNKIKETLGPDDEYYLSMTGAVIHASLNMLIEIVNAEQGKIKNDHSRLPILTRTVEKAISVMNNMAKFEMNDQCKTRFKENRNTIQSIKRQLDTANRQKSGDDASTVIRVIIGVVVLILVLARGCH